MTNPNLARDYFERAQERLKAVALLMSEQAFADVVRESQERPTTDSLRDLMRGLVESLCEEPRPGLKREGER